MDGKYEDGEEQTILEPKLLLNGNLVLLKQFNIGFPQLQLVQSQSIKEKSLRSGMDML